MRKYGIILIVLVAAGVAAAFYFNGDRTADAAAQAGAEQGRGNAGGGGPGGGGAGGGGFGGGGGGFGGGGFGGGPGGRGGARPPITIELASVSRTDMADTVLVVGNLVGAVTVDAVPRAAGRLENVFVKMGDRVNMGQRLAKIEDREIVEQVKQAEASYAVSQATIRQRDADLKLALNNLERSRSLLDRDLLPRQTFDDTDARYQAAQAQLDLAKAQMDQTKARLDELKINLDNTIIASPVAGFIGKRTLDPGASVNQNTSFISVVDIRTLRLVINVVERDLRRITAGTAADIEVDAYPGEGFTGSVARIAPILDPATRTAQVEIEIPNSGFRLKPGMYARARFTVDKRDNTLVVPTLSVVDVAGKIGVFMNESGKAVFHPITTGIEHQDFTEVTAGLQEKQQVVSTGAGALREGDRLVLAGARGGGAGRGGRRGGGAAAGESSNGEGPATITNSSRGAQPASGTQPGIQFQGQGTAPQGGEGRRGGGRRSGGAGVPPAGQ